MPNLMLDWGSAGAIAGVLVLVGLGMQLRRRSWTARFTSHVFEVATVLALYSVWQLANHMAHTRVAGAMANGHDIWQAERWLHLPNEVPFEHLLIRHPLLAKAADFYYGSMHFTVMIVFLVWLFLRHRDRYASWRTTMAVSTAGCLLLQMIPVAPPRMLTDVGNVDVALHFHESVYGAFGSGIADQLGAMPSIHVAWAFLIGVAVYRVSTRRWRWLALGYPILTTLVVVATANHYWADGIVAVVFVAVAWAAQEAVRRVAGVRRAVALPVSVPS